MKKILLVVLIVATAAWSVSASGIIKRRATTVGAQSWLVVHSDNFNRSNENPIGSPWITGYGARGQILDNVYANVDGSYNYAVDNQAETANQRVTVKALRANSGVTVSYIFLRAKDDLSTESVAVAFSSAVVGVYDNNNVVGTPVSCSVNVGDNVMVQFLDNTLTIYVNSTLKRSDVFTSWRATGKTGLGSNHPANAAVWDDYVYEVYQ